MKHLLGRRGLITKPATIPLVLLLALGVGAPLAGCAGDDENSAEGENIGSVGLNLEVAPGVTLLTVSYAISGNGFSKTGTIDVGDSPTISAIIGGIPAGNGYTVELSAVSAEDESTFTGSADFNVTARETTPVALHLKGSGGGSKGSVSVTATLNISPVIDELTATPTTVFVGGEVILSGVATDADEAPSALSYYWSTTGGIIDSPIAKNAKLTSDTPGTFTVNLTVSDGELTATKSTTIQFVAREQAENPGDAGPENPNILLIIADDVGAEEVSLYPDLVGDSGAVPTPNIEALAEDGVVFDNVWASPVCSPTRGTIVSGLYGHRTGVTHGGKVLPTSTVTLFDRIASESPATYGQAVFGKYHLGGGGVDPIPGALHPGVPEVLQHVRDIGINTFRGILGPGIADWFNWTTYDINGPAVANATYLTTALTDFAVDYIHGHEAEHPDQPWFLYQSYNRPINPQVPPADLHSVDLSSIGNPEPGQLVHSIVTQKAILQALDTEIGRLLAEVDLEKTVVIVLGDNGTQANFKDTGTGLRGAKASVYEGGVRVPLIVAGAGVTRRGREDELVTSTDLYATIASLAGVPVSHVANSYSLKPLLTDETAASGRTHSFTELSNGTSDRLYAIKDTRFKLLANLAERELYDLVADPLETTNLYTDPAYAAVRATLLAEIEELRAETPAYFP